MRYHFYIILVLLALTMAGCAEQINQPDTSQPVSDINAYGDIFFFESLEELVQKKQETIQNIESLGGREALMSMRDNEGNFISERDFKILYDPVELTALDYFYFPVYIETLCELSYFRIVDSNIAVSYYLKGTKNMSKSADVALEMHREPDPPALMKWILEKYTDLKPWQEAEGVYYEEVTNSFEDDVIQFYFLSDGECFFMRVSRELINEIRQTDPEALNGALFELRKIDL